MRSQAVFFASTLAIVIVGQACNDGADASDGGRDGKSAAAAAKPMSPAEKTRRDSLAADSIARSKIVRVPTPDVVRGLYVNRWAAIGRRMAQLIEIAKTTEVNALVIDVKDDRGFVLYKSKVPLAQKIGADTNSTMAARRVRAMLDTLAAHNIYPIARIVVAKDPLLANARLDWAIKRKDNGEPWLDKNGQPWLDPHQRGVWEYAGDLAKEAYDLGFAEVQFDYVRFPDEKRLVRETVYPLANGRIRAKVIRDQLGYLRTSLKPLKMPFTIDVFGLTATDTTDMGIGQQWEMFVDQADVVLPMVYPSHFAPGSYKIGNPNARPYAVIAAAMKDVKRRSANIAGAAKVVPWYQDFTLGPPRYGAEQIRAQKKAGYDNGFQSWVLWNPRSAYTMGGLEPESAFPKKAN